MRKILVRLMAVALVLAAPSAAASEPVKIIDVMVHPYYDAGILSGGRRMVQVGRDFDALLQSDRREDVAAARDKVLAHPELITPMTMMVLAIRLYDVGLRDDSVFWFYVAKDRWSTLSDTIDVSGPAFGGAEEAVKNFAYLAGPSINGYAFCDVGKQQAARVRAVDWVEQHPYQVIFSDRLPALRGDRRANLARSIAGLRKEVAEERAYLSDPKKVAALRAARQQNGADARYCW
ncbi:hypothetical protein [Phenylobacterium kunshanense]|uniref:Uncharacterized protein n=1 Tax=Phenylobacterium kunshanense TaxID=1445034 RepID=A0A328BFW3_9CAUL|nr:hypothetical protein [Phenylobacterium kunshanense]RAK65461.1 hypothetical protein DJ019_10890 [Phenylobacterium kunshanense]